MKVSIGRSGVALVPSESMAVYEKILTVFKNANPDLPIETFMIDKCMAEMGAIERIFPVAKIELCLYHVLDAFKKKLGTFRLKTEEAEPIQEILTYMALGCKSEEDYAEQLQELGNVCPPEFYVYFLRHWDSRRHRWFPYHRKENVNFGDRTSNRIESYHQKLKQEVARKGPLKEMFVNIMVSVRTLENEIKFRKFDTTFRRERSTHPHLQDMLTSYAYNHLMSEWASVHLYVCYESNEPTSDSVVQKAAPPSASQLIDIQCILSTQNKIPAPAPLTNQRSCHACTCWLPVSGNKLSPC
jgi:hypothetical protein